MKRLVGLLGIGLIVTLAFAAKSNLVEGGKIHYRGERFAKADSLFLESIKKGMAVEEAYLWHGKASVRLDNPIEAARAFLEVMNLDTTLEIFKKDEEAVDLAQIALYYGAQKLLYAPEKADTVVLFLRNAIKLSPQRETNYVLLGRFYLQNDKLDEALDIADELQKTDPESPEVDYLKGRVALAKNQYPEAIDFFKQSAAQFQIDLGKLEENIGIQLGAEKEDVQKMLDALAALEHSNDSVSVEDKEKLLVENFSSVIPSDAHAKNFLRWYSGYEGKKRQLGDAYDRLGQSYLRNRQYAEADSVLSLAMGFDPGNTDAMWNKGLASYNLKKYDEAIEYLKKVADAIGDDFYVYLYIGISYLQRNPRDLDAALEYLEKAQKIDPENPDIYRNLSVIYREKGDIKKASELLKKYEELLKQEGGNG